MIFGDTHVHSSFSADCSTPMEENVLAAIDKGLPYICLTDHIDYDFPVGDEVFDFDKAEYFETIDSLKRKYRDKIRVLAGVELGMQPHLKVPYEALLKDWPFDFVIGSQHLVRGNDPYYPETFEGVSDKEIYRAYFEEMLNNIKQFHGFDALGHLDYIIRYGKERRGYRYSEYADLLDEILKLLLKYNIAVEVNTAGIRKRLGFPNPQPEVLRRYREMGGTLVTVGSDSHKSYSIGYGFEQTAALLKSIGFTHIVCFEARHHQFIKL